MNAFSKYWKYGLLAVVVLFGISLATFYGTIVPMEENIKSLDAQIGNMYARQAALVPQIASTVKAAAAYEGGTLKDVTALRGTSQNLAKLEQLQADGKINTQEFVTLFAATSGGLKLMAEQYPQLSAVQGFRDLNVIIEGNTNRISAAIRDYDVSISEYNAKLRSFPMGIIAQKILGFTLKDRIYGESAKSQTVDTSVPDVEKLLGK